MAFSFPTIFGPYLPTLWGSLRPTRTNVKNPYDKSVYVKGDFTASHKEALRLYEDYQESLNHSNEKNILAKWIPNENYNLLTNNCTQKTMEVFFLGSLPDGTSVKQYVMSNGYGISVVPNLNILNMQRVFYNQATNRAGFDAAMQQQRNKYQGKGPVVQWWYRMLQRNISIIDG